MTGGYEREGSAALFGGHDVEEAAGRGATAWTGTQYPMHRHTDCRPAQHRQVQGRGAVAHPATILARTDIQAQVQARLDAPVVAVSLQELSPRQRGGWARGDQVFGVELLGRPLLAVRATGQAGGLLNEGKAHRLGVGIEGQEAAGFQATTVEFTGLNARRRVPRGKRRARGSGGVLARCRPRPFDCL